MHQTGQIYRPPSEASVQRLEVTIGCSHNKCSFCTMYRKTPFRVAPLEDVEMDLKELHDRGEKITRIYLTNGDPFVLGTDRLVKIAELDYFCCVKLRNGSRGTYLLCFYSESESKITGRFEASEKCRI